MSFMEGFANAVSENIVDKRKRKRDMEDDVFRANYNRYLTGLDDKKKQAESEKQAFTQADYLTKRYNLDAQATKVLAKALASGVGMEQLKEDLEKGTMEFGTPAQPSGPTTPAPSVNQEMQSSGLDPKEYMEEETPVNLIETGRTPVAADSMAEPERRKLSAQEKSVQKIAEMTGDNEENVRQAIFGKSQQDNSDAINWSFKPNSKQDAEWIKSLPLGDPEKMEAEILKLEAVGEYEKAQRAKEMNDLWVDNKNVPDGEGYMLTVDEKTGETKYITGKVQDGKFFNKDSEEGIPINTLSNATFFNYQDGLEPKDMRTIAEETKPFQQKTSGVFSYINSSMRAIEIVQKNPAAATATANLVSSIEGWGNEIAAAQEALQTIAPEAREGKINELMTKLRSMADKAAASGLNEDSRLLLKTQLDMAYAQLKAYGESGNSVSNLDMSNVMNSIFNPRPEKFASHLMEGVKINVEQLEAERIGMMKTSGSLIMQSRAHTPFITNDANTQLLTLATGIGKGEKFNQFLSDAMAGNDADYRPQNPLMDQNQTSETIQVPAETESNGMKLIGQSTDGQFLIYQDANGNKFKRKK